MRRTSRLGLTLGALVPASALPSAQNPQQPTFRAGTNVVRVDMIATRDGRIDDDLTASDVENLA